VFRNATIVSIALGLCLAAATAHAEGYAGFKGGVNLASFSGEGTFSPKQQTIPAQEYPGTRRGFTGGVFFGFDSSGRFGFRTDLLYTMKGGTNGDEAIELDYFEAAPLLVIRQPLGEKFGLRVFLGPVLGVFVNAEADNGPVDIDLGDIVKHSEVSGTLGAEFNMKAGPYTLLLDARYTQGTRIFEGEDLDGITQDFDVSNTGLALMAGVMVPF
jgi:opacity protein-like surface antigen